MTEDQDSNRNKESEGFSCPERRRSAIYAQDRLYRIPVLMAICCQRFLERGFHDLMIVLKLREVRVG